MPSSFSPLLRLTLPADGELVGTWGQTVNNGITSLEESAIAGTAVVAMADANRVLSTVNGAADEARNAVIRATGANTAQRDLIVPSSSKTYIVRNATTGGFGVQVKTAAGTGVVVPAGGSMLVYCDGVNVVQAIDAPGSLFFSDGTPALPGIAFASSVGTGFWKDATKVGVSFQGVARQVWSATASIFSSSIGMDYGVGGSAQMAWSEAGAAKWAFGTNVGAGDSTKISLYTYALGPIPGTVFTATTAGFLGVGIAAPVAKLHVFDSAAAEVLRVESGVAAAYMAVKSTAGVPGYFGSGSLLAGGANTDLAVRAEVNLDFGAGTTRKMRLTSAGDLLLGTIASPFIAAGRTVFQMDGTAVGTLIGFNANAVTIGFINATSTQFGFFGYTAIPLLFGTDATERARILSDGKFLVNTTAGFGLFQFQVESNSAVRSQVGINDIRGDSNTGFAVIFHRSGTQCGAITTTLTTTAYGTSSDARLKQNIVAAPYDPALMDNIVVHGFEFIREPGVQRVGVIAQELMPLVPEAVAESADDPEQFLQVDYSKLMPFVLLELQSLRARVTALGG